MMKLSTKPISSPGRTEKFPPPLMRFLRSNVGSRSRGRSRSSPMFLRKKASAAAAETQEPSSPKVTCMGQVRVRRSKQKPKRPGRSSRAGEPTRRRCKWFREALLCSSCRGTLANGSFMPDWRRWVGFFQAGCRRKGEIREEPKQIEQKLEAEIEESRPRVDEQSKGNEEEEEEGKASASSSDRPPMNALLLTRCRSAPYRSSSLAGRFWGSPLRSEEETEEEEEDTKTEQANRDDSVAAAADGDKPTSESDTQCRDSDQEPKMDTQTEQKSGLFKGPIRETTVKSELKTEEKEEGGGAAPGGGSVHPLLLTRCKSEPARTAGEKLDPEMNFWKLRRFGVADSHSPHVL